MKYFLVTLMVLAVSLQGQARGGLQVDANEFVVGCLSWEEVEQEYDLSQISASDTQTIAKLHANKRTFLKAASSHLKNANDQYQRIYICALVDEATFGFQYQCLDKQGQEMISQPLINYCESILLENQMGKSI